MKTLNFKVSEYLHSNAPGEWVSIRVTDEKGNFISGSYNTRQDSHKNIKKLIEKYS